MHVRIQDDLKDELLRLSRIHQRSAAREVNYALWHYIRANGMANPRTPLREPKAYRGILKQPQPNQNP